jgi:3-deoxy-D-manno-octulosonic-acid transferase
MAYANIKADYISFLPYDFLPSMLLTYARIKPKALIIVEAELWPNLLSIAKFKKVPAYLLNARISPRSMSRVQTFKTIFRTLINCFTAILTQTERDAELFSQLGIPDEKINVLGNLKSFNVVEKKANYLNHLGNKPQHPSNMKILLAGSIHPSEDLIYLELFKILKNHHPSLKLILAPRHFSWQDELIHNVKKSEHSFFVWTEQHPLQTIDHSSFSQAIEHVLALHDIILVCKLGELFTLYPYADIFFLGGTFVPVGGHNLLEPAVWSIPSIVGPHYQNCADFVERLKKLNGIITVQTKDDLITQTNQLLLNQPLREAIGLTSYQLVNQEALRVQKTLDILLRELKKH